jgi:hypothetical protein
VGHPLTPAVVRKPGQWRLWHLAVLVLLAAPVLGAVRAMATAGDRAIDGVSAAVVLGFAGLAPLALIQAGRWLLGPATSALKDWGVRIGGVVGFLVWVATIGLEVTFYVGSIVVAPVAVIFLLIWLARLAGR